MFVDFWETARWRAHGAMAKWLRQANIEMQSIAPREILMDYKFFDPQAIFALGVRGNRLGQKGNSNGSKERGTA